MNSESVKSSNDNKLPLLCMRELVIFPKSTIPYYTTDQEEISTLLYVVGTDRKILCAYPTLDHELLPAEPDLLEGYKEIRLPSSEMAVGSIATQVKVVQLFKLQNGSVRVILEGLTRVNLLSIFKPEDAESFSDQETAPDAYYATYQVLGNSLQQTEPIKLLMQGVKTLFTAYSSQIKRQLPAHVTRTLEIETVPDALIDAIAPILPLQKELRTALLTITKTEERLKQLTALIKNELQLLELQSDIQKRVKEKIEKTQKEYFLNEQILQIRKELGQDIHEEDEAEQLLQLIVEKNPPEDVIVKAQKEASRLKKLQTMSPESGIIRTYLEWLGELPWSKSTKDTLDILSAHRILEEDHYNMKKPKERILDYIAMKSFESDLKGSILCFVGPPGTGKTSLGKSVARALGRELVRVSLGGVRDEAEIRGHRRTYIGAMPGKIIQSMKKVGTLNPVFLLDEIDKMSSDFRGDPASAMLEVLDPEQNKTFMDHYIEIPFDLSKVLFIATANSIHTIPPALRDRMEIIEVPGYSDPEKYHIAKDFIIPKQLRENGLIESAIVLRKDAILRLIHEYTMESGVRELERMIGMVLRKVARAYLETAGDSPAEAVNIKRTVTAKTLPQLVGRPKYSKDDHLDREVIPGIAHGLAWTELGGRILSIEATLLPGTGKLLLTGNLGEVMKESARISLSYIFSHCGELQVPVDFLQQQDVHIHVPQGAIPKDGPSAGIALTSAILSALTKKPLAPDVAMTGEITLTGKVLPIGGVKEKLLAAFRNGYVKVILPSGNRDEVAEELPHTIIEKLTISYVDHIQEVFENIFEETITPLPLDQTHP